MCRTICMLAVFLALSAGAVEELREWKSKTGNTLEASFVKEEKGVVTLKKPDGVTVQAKLDALCEEDGEYVRDVTYVPQEIPVIFKQERVGPRYMESGTSKPATVRDTVVIQIDSARGDANPEIKGDTTWKVESVDAVGKQILARRENLAEKLTTEGTFVYLTYRVMNDSLVPIDVPSPLLYDQQGRKFSQAERGLAQYYIPEGTLFAGIDSLQPGFKKLYCAFYEMPEDAVPVSVEVFPSIIRPIRYRQLIRGEEPSPGKRIMLDVKTEEAAAAKPAEELSRSSDGKTAIFMRCTRVGQSGDTSGVWSFDRSKKRALAYGIELRVLGEQQKPAKIKAFFIGEATDNRDLVVDSKSAEVVLEPGKITRATLQSEEIEEQSYYYFSSLSRERITGAKLKGVIIQAWIGDELVSSWVSLNQWKKYAELPDVVKVMGELKKRENGF